MHFSKYVILGKSWRWWCDTSLVRNPVEGLVNAGVEPVFASYLDNQVDEELKIGSVNGDHCTGDFASANLASTS